MEKTQKVILVTAGVLIVAGGIAYFAVPPIIKKIEASTGHYDSFDNKFKKFVTKDNLGRAMLTTGVVVVGVGALTYGVQGLAYIVKQNTNLVNQFS